MTASTIVRSSAALLVAALSVGAPARASADETADLCTADSLEGQILRHHGRLGRAIEHLEGCSKTACEPAMRSRCTAWLAEAKAELPVLHIHVRDDLGKPLPGATVRIDGDLVDATRPLPIDPGHYELRATYAGRDAIVRVETKPGNQDVSTEIDLQSTTPARPVPKSVWVVGGISLAGFIAFTAFGVAALVQEADLQNCKSFCDASLKGPLETVETGADIGLGIGIAGAAVGTVLYLVRPTVQRDVRIGAKGVTWAF